MKTVSNSRRHPGRTFLVGVGLAALVSMPLAVPLLFGEDDASNAFQASASAACPDHPGTYDCLYEFPPSPSGSAPVAMHGRKAIDCGADDAGYDCDEAETPPAPSGNAMSDQMQASPYRPGEGG